MKNVGSVGVSRFIGGSIAFALTVAGGLAWGGVEGSKHDFSHRDWADGDMCGVCHTPHHTELPKAAPLWNPDADLSKTFGTSIGDGAMPGQGTLLCLRCHDGTIASEVMAGLKRDRFRHKQSPSLFSVGHGRSDHPVGVDFPQFDKGFRPMMSVIASGTVRLPDGKVECVSCHDPHNQASEKFMLVTSNARSALCLTCHKK